MAEAAAAFSLAVDSVCALIISAMNFSIAGDSAWIAASRELAISKVVVSSL